MSFIDIFRLKVELPWLQYFYHLDFARNGLERNCIATTGS
jgi:hypothetical protein